VLYETRAHHVGTFMGIPGSNRAVRIPGIRFLRFQDGFIAEIWGIYDYFTTALEIRADLRLTPLTNKANVSEVLKFGRGRRSPYLPKDASDELVGTGPLAANKKLLLHFQHDVFNANDWSNANLARFLKPDIIDHNAFPGDPPGIDGVRSRFSMWQAAFDDPDEENLELAGEDDQLAVLYNLHAVHRGDYLGIHATNRPVTIPGIEFLRFEDGLIAEHWGIYDFRETAAQIGAALSLVPRTVELPPRPRHPHARFVPAPEIRQ